MAVPPMLLQLIQAIAASVPAPRDLALIREHTTVFLGVALHVRWPPVRLSASVAGPARSSAMIDASGARAGLEVQHPGAEGGARRDTAVDSRGQAQGLWVKSSILRSKIGSLVCSVGRRKAGGREETLMDISSVGSYLPVLPLPRPIALALATWSEG